MIRKIFGIGSINSLVKPMNTIPLKSKKYEKEKKKNLKKKRRKSILDRAMQTKGDV